MGTSTTTNYGLIKNDSDSTFSNWLGNVNSNWDKISALSSLPKSKGSGSGSGEPSATFYYLYFNDGTIFMWGNKSAWQMNCTSEVTIDGTVQGYKSDEVTLNFPTGINITNYQMLILDGKDDWTQTGATDHITEVEAYSRSRGATSINVEFFSLRNDSGKTRYKRLDFFIIGTGTIQS